jgi:flagellar basal body-associated protein FliL
MKSQEQKDRRGSTRITITVLVLLVISIYIGSFFLMGV